MQPDAPTWREALAAYIAREAKPAEKFGHQPRLYTLTRLIAADLQADDDVLYAAAWLHDLGVFTGHRPEDLDLLARWDNVAYALEKTPQILTDIAFPPEKIPAVLECIRHHQPSATPESIESTILRDADILEQLGAIGILRTVCKVGRDTRFNTFSEAIRSLTSALDALPARLRLTTSLLLAEGRIQAHRDFLQAVQAEAGDLLL
jgi:uncharacterized protein